MAQEKCPKCGAPAKGVFCPSCGEMLAPGELDHFTFLGVEPRPLIDLETMKETYWKMSLRLHPDHAPRGRQEDATAWSSLLNRAYATLREEKTRLPYLISLDSGSGANPVAPGAAVVDREMMEFSLVVQKTCREFDEFAALRKSPLAAATAAMQGEWSEWRKRLDGLRRKVEERKARLQADLEAVDGNWTGTPAPRTGLHRELNRLASWFSYLSKFEGLVGERLLAVKSMGL